MAVLDFNGVGRNHTPETLTQVLRNVYSAKTNLEAALAFAVGGVYIFPERKETCYPIDIPELNFGRDYKDGKPVSGTGGYKKAQCDPAIIRKAWEMYPDADIEVIIPYNFVVYDLDAHSNNNGIINNGIETYKKLQEGRNQWIETFTVETPRGGRHVWLYEPDRQTAKLRRQDHVFAGVDIKVGGYQIKEGPRYKIFKDVPIVENPIWLYTLTTLAQAPKEKTEASKPLPQQQQANVVTIEGINDGIRIVKTSKEWFQKRVSDALTELSNATQGNRNQSVNVCAFKFGQMVYEQAFTKEWALDRIKEAVQPLLANDFTWEEAERTIKSGIDSGCQKPAIHDFKEEQVAIVSDMDGFKLAEIEEPTATKWDEDLLHPGGLLEEIMNYTEKSSFCSIPMLNLAGALVIIGTIAGRKFRTDTHLTTNIDCVILGESGTGKDAPNQTVKKLLSKIDYSLFGGNDVASAPAVLTKLKKSKRCCFTFDEFGLMMKACKNPNSPKAELVKIFTELYSCYDSIYVKPYANEFQEIVIPWQNLCFLGFSVPDEFWGAMQDGESTNGFIARLIIFDNDGVISPENEHVNKHIPEELIEKLQAIYDIDCNDKEEDTIPLLTQILEDEGLSKSENDIDKKEATEVADSKDKSKDKKETKITNQKPEKSKMVKPYTIHMTQEAFNFHMDKCKEYRAIAFNLQGKNSSSKKTIYHRFGENAAKISLVKAISRLGASIISDPSEYRHERKNHIETEDVKWAWKLIETTGNNLIKKIDTMLYTTQFEKWCNDAVKAIENYVRDERNRRKGRDTLQKPGAPRSIIEGKLSIPIKNVSEVLDKLVSTNKIRLVQGWKSSEKSKRPLDLYCIIEEQKDVEE